LSLSAIARSILEPKQPTPLQQLQRLFPVLMDVLERAYATGVLDADEATNTLQSIDDVLVAYHDIEDRQQGRKLGEAYDVRREETSRLKVKATSSLSDFNETLSQIAELASRLRDAGNLEESEFLALLNLQELLRRASREIILWAE